VHDKTSCCQIQSVPHGREKMESGHLNHAVYKGQNSLFAHDVTARHKMQMEGRKHALCHLWLIKLIKPRNHKEIL